MDDEEIIVNGLYEIFSGLERVELDVYRAYSGREAIQWLNRTRMDVVLTDIRMPEIDGLQLMDEILKRWPWCRVIFLTGHSEFDYVYRAIQHPSVSYLLKTEDHDKIIGTVEDVVRELQDQLMTGNLIQNAKEQMDRALELLQRDFFTRLLGGDSSLQVNKGEFEQLRINLNPGAPVILVLGGLEQPGASTGYWEQYQLLYSVRQLIARYLATHVNSLMVLGIGSGLAIFVQPCEAAAATHSGDLAGYSQAFAFLRGTLEVVQNACRESLGAPISFAISEETCQWENLAAKYGALSQLLAYRIGEGLETLLDDGEFRNSIRGGHAAAPLQADTGALQTLLRNRNLSALQRLLESGRQPAYFEALMEWLEPLGAVKDKHDPVAMEAYQTLALLLLSYINRWTLTPRLLPLADLERLIRSDRFPSWRAAGEFLLELSRVLFQIQSEDQRKRTGNTVDFLQRYIETHLGEDLSLVNLAEQVHLNPSYLSRLYRQVTGVKLSEFIESARIHRAKALLEDSRKKIQDIASLVGYDTAASFTRFFKNVEGVSPQEYRDTYLAVKMSQQSKQ